MTLGPKFSSLAVLIAALIVPDGASRARQTGGSTQIVPDQEAFYAAVRDNLARAQGAVVEFSYKERRTNVETKIRSARWALMAWSCLMCIRPPTRS